MSWILCNIKPSWNYHTNYWSKVLLEVQWVQLEVQWVWNKQVWSMVIPGKLTAQTPCWNHSKGRTFSGSNSHLAASEFIALEQSLLFLCLWPACVLSSVIKIGHRNDYNENETDDKLYHEDRLTEKPSDKLWTSQLVSVWWGSGAVGYSV